MKILIVILMTLMVSISAQAQFFNDIIKKAEKIIDNKPSNALFSSDEAAKAIKEALISGTSKGTDLVSQVDGFYKNPEIRIPIPPQAQKVESVLRSAGLGGEVDKAVLSLNRAAEDASKSAKDIFVSAIQKMSIEDAINIVKGDTNSATKYLKSKTTASLTKAFSPIIKVSLDKVDATKYWGDLMKSYNQIPFVEKIEPDLTKYVTQKALDALFLMISKEESLIRKDPIARTSDILKKVFGK